MKYLAILALAASLVACKSPITDGTGAAEAFDAESTSADLVVDSLNKMAEDFDTDVELEGPAEVEEVDVPIAEVDPETLPPEEEDDEARNCARPAVRQKCRSNGVESAKIAKYKNCPIPGTRLKARGYVKLHFNNARCSLRETGEEVNRTYNVSFTNPKKKRLQVSSDAQRNYKGELHGGGGVLTKLDDGFELNVLGRNTDLYNSRGRKVMDVSMHTARPINIIGTLNKERRMIDGGALQVDHNLAKFTTTYIPEELVWTSACSCPQSGKLIIENSGSVNNGGSIEFLACGHAKLTRDNGFEKEVRLEHCLEE